MDWEGAIEKNRADLIRVVAWLFTWLKIEEGGSIQTLPRINHGAVLFVLRPAESALRRLIFVASIVYRITAPLLRERPTKARSSQPKPGTKAKVGECRALPFRLIDPRKRFDLFPDRPKYATGPGPRITVFGSDDPIFDRSDLYAYQERMATPPAEDISGVSLCRRLNAVKAALDDLPAQARRLVALKARMKRRNELGGKPNLSVMRPGAPPGYRRRHKHEVDAVLYECQQIALMAMREPPDTS